MNSVRRSGLTEMLIGLAALAAVVAWYYVRYDLQRVEAPAHLNAFMVPFFNAFLLFAVQGAIRAWTGRELPVPRRR